MADGSVIIRVEMDTDGVRAGVKDIRAGCGKAAEAAERTGRTMTRAMSDGTRAAAAWGGSAQRAGERIRLSCGSIREGMSAVEVQNARTGASLEQMRACLNGVRASLATAFAPVVTAAAPLLIRLSELVAKAANYVAMFFAVLRGKNTYKKAVAAQEAITESVAGTGAAAKEAARNLSGLDELNIWKENKAGSGGGGGGAGFGTDVDMEDVPVGEAADFVVRLRDILFEWDDLNPELIAEKILTGLCAAAGGIIGYTMGGPLGGLVGLTMGALLGVKLSQITFDGDGRIDKEEAAKLIITAVCGLIGGVAGAVAGGPTGAAIGFAIGAGVSVLIGKALFNGDGKLDGTEVTKLVLTALGGLIGGVLGFVIGGPLGAAIGFAVGAGISVALSNAEIKEGVSLGSWVKEKVIGLVQKAVDAYHAVVEFAAKIKNDAAAWWSSVKSWWGEKVGSVQSFATGVVNSAAAWWSSVKTWWSGKVGSVQSFATAVTNSAATWWSNVKSWWKKGIGDGKVQSFTTAVTNSANTWWNNVKGWWKGRVGAVQSFTTAVKNNAKTWWSSVKSWWSQRSQNGVTFKASVTSFVDKIKNKTLDFKANITSFLGNAKQKVKSWLGLATGGIYKNGQWHRIEGYASGGSPRRARLFYANENGMPELVGQIGGHTAVMNNGQIVSSVAAGVYRAVAAAMGQVGGWFRSMSDRLGDIPPAIEMLSAMPAQTPQPVMATGTVLPPRAVYGAAGDTELLQAARALREALDRQGPDRDRSGREPVYNVALELDGKTLLQAVLTHGRLRQIQGGGNPFMELMGG